MEHNSLRKPARMDFYHVMIYVSDVRRAKEFYELLGLEILEDREGYARLRFPGGLGTIALHEPHEEEPRSVQSPGIRLYFEVQDLDLYCEMLASNGIRFDQPPRLMEWGWKHAYLRDPDDHEISLFYAGDDRIKSHS